jgi:hypothetical protein
MHEEPVPSPRTESPVPHQCGSSRFSPQARRNDQNEGTPKTAPAPIRRTGHLGRQTWGRSDRPAGPRFGCQGTACVVVGNSEHNLPSVASAGPIVVLLRSGRAFVLVRHRGTFELVRRLFFDSIPDGSADHGLGTHQRHPRSQQLATSYAELTGLPRAGAEGTRQAIAVDDANVCDVSLKYFVTVARASRTGKETLVMNLTETAGLMEANLLQVFNERDPARRREVIARTYAVDVRWTDDDGTTVGHDALNTKAHQLLDGPLAGLEFVKKGGVCGTTGLE